MAEKAAQCRRDRSALSARVDDQHDRPAGEPGELGGRTGLAIGARSVEQPHHAFAKDNLGGGLELGNEAREGLRPHRPDVEVYARLSGRSSVKTRVDEIGPGFRRGNTKTAPAQMARQPGGNQGLAAA